jgi:hypothetical protein
MIRAQFGIRHGPRFCPRVAVSAQVRWPAWADPGGALRWAYSADCTDHLARRAGGGWRGDEAAEVRNRADKLRTYAPPTGRRLEQPPPAGYANWSAPLLARELGDIHEQYIWRFLRAQKIDLSGRKSWCESNDPDFVAKAAQIVGLYMMPPENAVVLSVDEKPSIQALEWAQGYLKLPNGRAMTGQSHDYKRNGTTTLFAAFDVGSGEVLGRHYKRPAAGRVPRLHELGGDAPSGQADPRDPGQPLHPQTEARLVARAASHRASALLADPSFLAEPDRGLVLHPGRQVPQRAARSAASANWCSTLTASSPATTTPQDLSSGPKP